MKEMWFFYEKPSLFSLSHTRWLSLLYLTDWLTLFSFSKGYESHFKKVKVGSEIDFCMTRQVLVSEGMRLPIGMLISNLDVFKHWNSGGGSFVIGNVKRLHQFSSLWLKKTNVANLFLWVNSGLFLIYFPLFKYTLQFSQQIQVKKCPSGILCQDSNSRPLEHESPNNH